MKNLRKLYLCNTPTDTNKIQFIPVDEIVDCESIIPDEKMSLQIYVDTIKGGASDSMGDHVNTRSITAEDITMIRQNGGFCFTEVDHTGKLSMPSNALGHRLLVLHLTN